MTDSERFALAARLYSAMKRSTGRVIDVLWLLQNEAYAQEVLRLARGGDAECVELASRIERSAPGSVARPRGTAAEQSVTGSFPAGPGTHYVRGLR